MKRAFSIWLLPMSLIGVSACVGDFDCNFDDCEVDADCPEGSICTTEDFSLGLSCVDASRCDTNADCDAPETCVIDEGRAADHPFEQDVAARGVCTCDLDCQQATTSSVGGSGGAGGAGAGGSGGSGGAQGGAGGSHQGGSGGAGGLGGSGGSGGVQGGAGGGK